jgi:uncharacterized membrane protein
MFVTHPPFVHFVVALPFAALFSQLTYLVTKDFTYSKAAFRILAFSLLMGLFALYTGVVDAENVLKNHEILQRGVLLLSQHKTLGFIVVTLLLLSTLAKWIAVSKKSLKMEKLSLFLIIVTILASLYQGNKGGELVYKNGAGIDGKIIQKRIQEMQAVSKRP